jgi:hypothetical protein
MAGVQACASAASEAFDVAVDADGLTDIYVNI